MALGSSAPEILLNVIETVQTLGSKPGELGPSTIVGSAAFNFLIISGLSIYAVNESNDTRSKQERDDAGTPAGVKKVQDTGVFAITTVWSIVAYIWLYVVLLDGIVKEWEAYLTLGFFFALIGDFEVIIVFFFLIREPSSPVKSRTAFDASASNPVNIE